MTLRPLFSRVKRVAREGLATALARPSRLGYNRLCNVEDFEHPAFRRLLREIFAYQLERVGPSFPLGRETRKEWEVAMAARTLADFGCLHRRAEILGVGAGHEPTIFWLTNHVGRVFATDLYLEPGVWKEFCNASMLTEPGRHWPSAWDPRRLVVQHMDALELRHPDASFDGVFSSSSIEHFGGPAEVRRSLEEIHRVLKPGGVLSISTEFRLEGPGPGIPGTLLFDEREVRELFLDGLGWDLVGPLDLEVSPATRASELPVMEYIEDFHAHFARHGQVVFHELDFSRYPQILLRHGESLFTSLHLALRKRAD
jgi:SAM-dependent methyltransferase